MISVNSTTRNRTNRSRSAALAVSTLLVILLILGGNLDGTAEVPVDPHLDWVVEGDPPELIPAWDSWHRRVDEDVYEQFLSLARSRWFKNKRLAAGVEYRVGSDKSISDVHIFRSSSSPKFDNVVAQAIKNMSGSPVLQFPKNSKQTKIKKSLTLCIPRTFERFIPADMKSHEPPIVMDSEGGKTPINRLNVNDILVPAEQRKFDSDLWKKQPSSRLHMLCAVYQLHLHAMPAEQVFSLLGMPTERRQFDSTCHKEIYELGLKNKIKLFLEIDFKNGKESYLTVKQKAPEGTHFRTLYSDWCVQNSDWPSVAAEFNRLHHLVGAPVTAVPNYTYSHEEKLSGHVIHVLDPFEIEYTADNSKVKRFRMRYRTGRENEEVYTKWQDEEIPSRSRCLDEESDSALREAMDEFRNSGRFSRKEWLEAGDGSKGRLSDNPARSGIADLVRSYPLIGMSRSAITALLGDAYRNTYPTEDQDADPLCADTESFQLLFGVHCGMASRPIFELAFKNDRVVAYRKTSTPGYRRKDTYTLVW